MIGSCCFGCLSGAGCIREPDPVHTFTELIVRPVAEFALGEDVQRPLFYNYFASSQSFQIYLFLAQMKGGNSE